MLVDQAITKLPTQVIKTPGQSRRQFRRGSMYLIPENLNSILHFHTLLRPETMKRRQEKKRIYFNNVTDGLTNQHNNM